MNKQVTSYNISLVPFLENDDQTRLQMASSQMRHTLSLVDSEIPMVCTGFEYVYGKYLNEVCIIAKKPGKVLFIYDHSVCLGYSDGTGEIKNINTNFQEGISARVHFRFIEGEEFDVGDVIAEYGCINGVIAPSINLNTVILSYRGLNYQDGIVISESCGARLTTYHTVRNSFILPEDEILTYIDEEKKVLLPENGYVVTDSYATIRKGSGLTMFQTRKLYENKVFIGDRYELYPNNLPKYPVEFSGFVEEYMERKTELFSNLIGKTEGYTIEERGLNYFIKIHNFDVKKMYKKYKLKNKSFDGIYVDVHGHYYKKMEVGDKLANRHGNKGVVSAIRPDDKMIQTSIGPADIVINPFGIVSRMNEGQLFEQSMAMCIYRLRSTIGQLVENGSYKEAEDLLMEFLEKTDETDDRWFTKQTKEQIDSAGFEKFVEEIHTFVSIQPPFECTSFEKLEAGLKMFDLEFSERVYDPETGEFYNSPVGHMYWNKLYHLASNKIGARSIRQYNRRVLQPVRGAKDGGGQRLGEMEVYALISHNATEVLKEFFDDSVAGKLKMISNAGFDVPKSNADYDNSVSNDLLKQFFGVLNLTVAEEETKKNEENEEEGKNE